MDPKYPLPEFETFVRQVLEQWHIPGLSAAIVKEDRTILCTGFGMRNIAGGLPVTGDTLFPIASCSKAFTALAMGMLVEEGRLDWDAPVREVMPDFRLYDEVASQRITPRDLLCHRSGLPGHDVLWYASNFSRQEILRRLRYLEPSCDMRTRFQYQNLMYIVAGLLIERVTGQCWESFVGECIFKPLGMRRSGFSTVQLRQDPDHSRPYFYRQDEIVEIPYFEADGEKSTTGGAGGIVSCASDMARWLSFQLQDGCLGDTRLVSPEIMQQMRQPHIFIEDPDGQVRYGFEFTSYGLGWSLHMHKGQVLAAHDGIADGFSAFVALMPRRGLGVALLSNADFSSTNFNYALGVIAYTVFDRLLGLEPTDWNSLEKAHYNQILAYFAAPTAQAKPKSSAPPSHPLEAYLGDYVHPGYGTVSVLKTEQGLSVSLNGKLTYPLEHDQYDIFDVIDQRFGRPEKVCFSMDTEGNICGFSIRMEPAVKPAMFERK
jgi:CubicO group peptidase (beta-lactamase class C family)